VTSEYRGMPPAGVVVLTLPADASFEPGVAQLSAFWWP
jgi:phosphohistidine phosphatase